jgi:hypothetical protein
LGCFTSETKRVFSSSTTVRLSQSLHMIAYAELQKVKHR